MLMTTIQTCQSKKKSQNMQTKIGAIKMLAAEESNINTFLTQVG